MSAVVAVVCFLMGVVLTVSAAVILTFRERVGANVIAAGVAGRGPLKAATVGAGLGLIQLFVAAGFFVLAVVVPRRLEETRIDAVVAHLSSAAGPWSGILIATTASVGAAMILIGLPLLRRSWTERETWRTGHGHARVTPRSRLLIYEGIPGFIGGLW
jgi:hypothetical protein